MKSNKLEYAIRMIEFHSKLLIKWSKYVEKETRRNKDKKEESIPDGQMSIFDEEKGDD